MEVLDDPDTASGFKQVVARQGSETCSFRPPTAHQTACPVELEEGLRPPNNPHHQAVGALL